MKWVNKGIVKKCLIGAAVLLLFSCACYHYEEYVRNLVIQSAKYHTAEVVRLVGKLTNERIGNGMKFVEISAQNPEIADNDHPENNLAVLVPGVKEEGFKWMSYIDKDGNGYTTDGHRFTTKQDFVEKAMQGYNGFSGVIDDVLDPGTNIMAYSVPVRRNGTIVGVLTAAYSMDMLEDIVDVPIFDTTGLIHITDRKGNEVFSGIKDDTGNWHRQLNSVRTQLISPNAGGNLLAGGHTGRYTIDGEDYYFSYAPIGIEDWYIMGLIPVKVAFSSLASIAGAVVLFLVFVLALLLLAACVYIAVQIRHEATLQKMAFNDELTSLGNKNYFLREIQRLQRKETKKQLPGRQKWALLVFDVDHFRWINRTFGIQGGDAVLKAVAQILQEEFTHQNEKISHIYTDKFAILKHVDTQEEVEQYAQRLINRMSQLTVDKRAIFLQISVGIFMFDNVRSNSEQFFFDRANDARKSIKSDTDKRYAFYDNNLQREYQQEDMIKNELQEAISHGDLYVCYQPKYSCNQEEKLIGAEALVRWFHVKKGEITPGQFIPIAERYGLIWPITKFVFETVCRDYQEWATGEYTPVTISVNLSSQDLYQAEFLTFMKKMVEKYHIAPGSIELEVTETAFIRDVKSAIAVLKQLKELGFPISVDDFGTGYSALCYLQSGVFDVLKLDRSFLLRREQFKEQGEKLIRAICSMAKSMDMFSICEGAETKEQVEFLHTTDCNGIQGFYYSPPIAKDIFTVMLGKQTNSDA